MEKEYLEKKQKMMDSIQVKVGSLSQDCALYAMAISMVLSDEDGLTDELRGQAAFLKKTLRSEAKKISEAVEAVFAALDETLKKTPVPNPEPVTEAAPAGA